MTMLTEAFWEAVDELLDGMPETEDAVRALLARGGEAYENGDLKLSMLSLGAAWRLSDRVLGPEHLGTLASMHSLAMTLRARGDPVGAELLQREVLEVIRRVLGPDHPATLKSMGNLAGTLRARGDLAGAEPLYREVLAAQRRMLGPEHRDTLTSMNNLGELLRVRGDLAGAESLLREVLGIFRRVLGPEHPHTLRSVGNLALTLRARGDLAGAEALQHETLEVSRRVLGPEHPDTLTSMSNLAMTLRSRGDLARAEEAETLLAASCQVVDRLRALAGDDVARAQLGATMGAGRANIILGTLRARLGRPASEVFAALERGWGRAALDILNRGGVGSEQLAVERLDPERFERYKADRVRLSELTHRRDALTQQIAATAGDARESLIAELRVVSDEMSSVGHRLRVLDREVLPESRVRDLAEVRAVLVAGELLIVLGWSGRAASAVLVSHDGEAAALVSEDEDELKAANALAVLISMGISPEWHYGRGYAAALERVGGDESLAARLGTACLKDCRDRVERMLRNLELVDAAIRDAVEGGWPFDRKTLDQKVEAIPTLPWETLRALSAELLRVLLPEQIRSAMVDADRVILVPSGPVHMLPLSMLIEAAGIDELNSKPIVYTPSASVLAMHRQAGAAEGRGASIAGWAWFGDEDPAEDPGPEADRLLARSELEIGLVRDLRGGLARLPRSKSEAEQIAALFEKAGVSRRELLLDRDASKRRVVGAAPGRRHVHIASHALLSSPDRPMESAIALSVGESDNGMLSLGEFLGEWGGKLGGCELVALSACQTSRGVEVGDSLMALPLGLLHAGAKRVLASLWSVPDIPTWLLMRRFYENMLGVRHHDDDAEPRTAHGITAPPGDTMPAPTALAEAQAWMRDLSLDTVEAELDELGDVTPREAQQLAIWRSLGIHKPFRHPANWAAFVIVGDV